MQQDEILFHLFSIESPMKVVFLLQKSIVYQMVLIPLILSSLFAGSIEMTDGVLAKGIIKAVTLESVKFQKDENLTIVEIPNKKIRFIEICGLKFTFKTTEKQWVRCADYSGKLSVIDGEIVMASGVTKRGVILTKNSKHIRFKSNFDREAKAIPNNKIQMIIIKGQTYSFNTVTGEWSPIDKYSSGVNVGRIITIDSISAHGLIIEMNAKNVRFRKSGSPEIVTVHNSKISYLELNETPFQFNRDRYEWAPQSVTSAKKEIVSVLTEDEKNIEKAMDISISKYTSPFTLMVDLNSSAVLDSIYTTNFYELRYKGYNFELSEEVYAFQDICGIPSDGKRPEIENPRKSGIGNMVFGFILLGWGVGINGLSAILEEPKLLIGGIGLWAGAGISFVISNKRKKEHDQWEKKHE